MPNTTLTHYPCGRSSQGRPWLLWKETDDFKILRFDERYQLDATIYLLLQITLHVSGIYMTIFSIGLYTYYTTAYGVQQ